MPEASLTDEKGGAEPSAHPPAGRGAPCHDPIADSVFDLSGLRHSLERGRDPQRLPERVARIPSRVVHPLPPGVFHLSPQYPLVPVHGASARDGVYHNP
jgi:hypothetical protein